MSGAFNWNPLELKPTGNPMYYILVCKLMEMQKKNQIILVWTPQTDALANLATKAPSVRTTRTSALAIRVRITLHVLTTLQSFAAIVYPGLTAPCVKSTLMNVLVIHVLTMRRVWIKPMVIGKCLIWSKYCRLVAESQFLLDLCHYYL